MTSFDRKFARSQPFSRIRFSAMAQTTLSHHRASSSAAWARLYCMQPAGTGARPHPGRRGPVSGPRRNASISCDRPELSARQQLDEQQSAGDRSRTQRHNSVRESDRRDLQVQIEGRIRHFFDAHPA
jgi:hypothetical protein